MIYLDYAATTPVDPLVLEAMKPYFLSIFGNPSSLHLFGQQARRGLETAREQVAEAIGAKAKEIVFTSGATEAINQVIRGFKVSHPGAHILTSRLEHKAVLSSCEWLAEQESNISYLSPDESGVIRPEQVQAALRPDTCLVALMLVNNETGVKTDIAAIADVLRHHDALLFCDAVQAFAYEPIDVAVLGVDYLALSAHKAYGPKGVGALFIREGVDVSPFMLGGEQERGLRAGTHNLASIVGMGMAAKLVQERQVSDHQTLVVLKEAFEQSLLELEGVSINGFKAARAAKHSSVRVEDIDGEALLLNLDSLGVAASAGSACAAGSLEPSHVLTAMGLSPEAAKASIRFSLGRGMTEEMLEQAVTRFKLAIERCRVFT